MIPALLLVGVGWQRRVPLPLPVFVLWPLVAVAVLVTGAVQLVRRVARPAATTPLFPPPLEALFQLFGLRVDVRDRDGGGVFFWLL